MDTAAQNQTDTCGFSINPLLYASEYVYYRRTGHCPPSVDAWSAYAFFVLLGIGTIGNGLGCVLFIISYNSRRNIGTMRKVSMRLRDQFLIGFFAVDFLYLWNRFLLLWSSDKLSAVVHCLDKTSGVVRHQALWNFSDVVLMQLSQGLLAAYAVDRYMAVAHPMGHLRSHRTWSRNPWPGAVTLYVVFVMLAAGVILFNDYGSHNASPRHIAKWNQTYAWIQTTLQLTTAATITLFSILTAHRIHQSTTHFRRNRHTLFPRPASPDATLLSHLSKYSPNFILITSTLFYWLANGPDLGWAVIITASRYPLCMIRLPHQPMLWFRPVSDVLRHLYAALGFVFYAGTWLVKFGCRGGGLGGNITLEVFSVGLSGGREFNRHSTYTR